MEAYHTGSKRVAPQTASVVPGTAASDEVERLASGTSGRVAHEPDLPPVWIRLPDVGPDDTIAEPVETREVEDDTRAQRGGPLLGGERSRQGSSLVTIAAVAILAITLYLVLPGGERGRPLPPDTGPPPIWNPSADAAHWRDSTADSPPSGDVVPRQDNQTVGSPPDEAQAVPDEQFGDAPPWRVGPVGASAAPQQRVGLAELDGTIETSTFHRARREPGDASLH